MPVSPPPDRTETRRDRRIARQRQAILQAAARVFAERGYAGTTTRDIAREADIGESTLYNYFKSKRDILLAIANQQAKVMDTVLLKSLPEDRKTLVALVDRAMEHVFSQTLYTRALVAEAWVNDEILEHYLISRAQRIARLLRAHIARQVAAGVFRPVDPDLGARVVLGMFAGALLPGLRGKGAPPSAEQRRALAETMVMLLLDGFLASGRRSR